MTHMNYLEAFKVYKIPSTPIVMPENISSRKKNIAYMVIAPTIEQSLKFISTTTELKFRNLTNYFIEKRWKTTLYGRGNLIIQPDETGEVTNLVEANKRGNLKNITSVTSYLNTLKTRPMKDYNVLVECNHVTEAILDNPKDRRFPSQKIDQLLSEYNRIYKSAAPDDENYLGAYQKVYTIIPMELWFTVDDYSNPAMLMKHNSKNVMGLLLNKLCSASELAKFGPIVLTEGSLVLILDATSIPEDAKPDFIRVMITKYMAKARSMKTGRIPEDEIDPETGAITDTSDISMTKALDQSRKDDAVDLVLDQAKIDPDTVSVDKIKQIGDIIEKNVKDTRPGSNTHPTIPEVSKDDLDKIIIKDPSDVDVILTAKMQGRSVESVKRNQMLKEKYRTLNIGNIPVSEIIESEKQYEIPPVQTSIHTVNSEYQEIKSHNFERAYNRNVAPSDLVNILMHFSTVKPALYLNKDIQIEDISTDTDRIYLYTVDFEDEDRVRHHVKFKLPKMYKDKYLFLNGQQLNIIHQKLPYPITKTSPDRCQLVSNYNKIFSFRYGTSLSPKITVLKKFLGGPECPNYVKITKGDSTIPNKPYLTTLELDDLSSLMTRIVMGNRTSTWRIYLDLTEASAIIPNNMNVSNVDDDSLTAFATKQTGKGINLYYFISGKTNQVYDQNGTSYGEFSDFLVNTLIEIDPKNDEIFKHTATGSRFIYAKSKVMAEDVPMILVLGAGDPGGLAHVLEKSKINYYFTDKRPKIDKAQTGVVAWKDGWLVFDRYPYENSLLMNGLSTFPTTEYNYYDMGKRETYIEIFDLLFNRRNLIDGLENFYYMMIDPITKDVLMKLDMPTDYITLMLYCCGVLADNNFQIDSVYFNSRLRSNEIIYAHLYRELAAAWAAWKDGRADKVSIPEDIIIKLLMTANIVDPHTSLNVTLEAENDRQVKLKGPSGMNEDHSFTLEKRAYHPSMRGIVAMNSTPSGEVGINRHLSLNAKIIDSRGFIDVGSGNYNGTELASPGELLQTFGLESADMERVAMSISQSKHMVPTADQTSSAISYDMERVIPYLSSDFAFTSKADGKVISVDNDIMIVQYKDGTYDDIDLSERPVRNTDGGFEIINQLIPNVEVGKTFKANTILAYDPKYINNRDIFGDLCANVGTMARAMIVMDGGVYEDATYMTDEFAHRIATKITKSKRVILSKFANIKYMVKVGDHVKSNDPILTFDDTEDEFTSKLLASMAEEAEDTDEVIATTAPVISKYTGTIKGIDIIYTIPLEEMTPSMRKIVEKYTNERKKRIKTLSKYIDPRDSNTILPGSEMSIPDSTGKVGGIRIGEGVSINFHIEYDDVASVGDKITNYTALKGTDSFIIPAGLAPYAESNPDRKIDVALSTIGVYKRMTLDIVKVGALTKLLIERKRQLKDKYLERFKTDLKNK